MIASFSASSPLVSVALIASDGSRRVLAARERELRTGASGMLLTGLQECLYEVSARLEDVACFAADTGPGSFIGIRVAVTLAKTLAYANGRLCYAVTSFDLIDPIRAVVVPNRRNEWFVREVGATRLVHSVPEGVVGYGVEGTPTTYPHASRFDPARATPVPPEALTANYLIEPSISTPKAPYTEARP